jgi:hypothetical protein
VDARETADGEEAMSGHLLRSAWLALGALSMGAAGCTAIPPETGAPSGVYFRGRSAECIVPGDLPAVSALARAVLADLGVTVGTREADADDLDLEIRGTGPDGRAVHVDLAEDADGNTRVRASARVNTVEWDRDYARIVVERIVERLNRGRDPSTRLPGRTPPHSSRRPVFRGATHPQELPPQTGAPAAHSGSGGTPPP